MPHLRTWRVTCLSCATACSLPRNTNGRFTASSKNSQAIRDSWANLLFTAPTPAMLGCNDENDPRYHRGLHSGLRCRIRGPKKDFVLHEIERLRALGHFLERRPAR